MDEKLLAAQVDRLCDKLAERATSVMPRIGCTIDEAAAALGVSRRTVEGLLSERRIKTVQVGRYKLVSVRSLYKLIDG